MFVFIVTVHSGQIKRAALQRLRHGVLRGQYASPFWKVIDGIPRDIQTLARRPFSIMAMGLFVPDLGLYTAPYVITLLDPPPAAQSPGDYNDDLFALSPRPDDELLSDDALRQAYNASYYGRFKAEGRKRYNELTSVEVDSAIDIASQQLEARIHGWKESIEGIRNENTGARVVLGAVGLEWGAKLVCCLAKEVELLKAGRDALRLSYENELLPWQCMNLSVR